jgi:hypothetical protein
VPSLLAYQPVKHGKTDFTQQKLVNHRLIVLNQDKIVGMIEQVTYIY